MKLKTALARRVGPFALWVWGIAGIAGVIVLRHLKSSSSSGAGGGSSSAGASGDLGRASISDAGGGGGGGGDQPMQPAEQQPVDDAIANGGVGTPVVFDPLTTGYTSDDGRVSPSGYTPSSNKVVLPGGAVYDPETDTVTPPKSTHLSAPTPRSSGQKTKTPVRAMPPPVPRDERARPAARASKPTVVSSGRAQTTAPAAVSKTRSATAAQPNNQVRTVAMPPPVPKTEIRTVTRAAGSTTNKMV